jgi:hypothetical protein
MKKKYTIIVIGDKRRIGSFEISAATLITAISFMLGLVLILFTLLAIGTFSKNEANVKLDSADRQATSATQRSEDVSDRQKRQGDDVPRPPADLAHKLSIENFKAYYNPARNLVRYKFLLKNQSEDSTVSGRIFVVLKSGDANSTSWLVFPKTALNDGTPKNYKDGDPFSISKYKIIQNHISTNAVYDSIVIYVFSTDGSLTLKNSFNIRSS